MLRSFYKSGKLEAGCDEAGRGCLAGPVFAAAVIFPTNYRNKHINDSKKVNEADRITLAEVIKNDALSWAVARVDPPEIDRINILNASFLAMHKAIKKLSLTPGFLLIDGNRFNPFPGIDHACIIKGDSLYIPIAAASILAKTSRDAFISSLGDQFPHYGWKKNKGYPTAMHRRAIETYGTCPHHRKTFRLLFTQSRLFS